MVPVCGMAGAAGRDTGPLVREGLMGLIKWIDVRF